ncbi:hypothetical protein [Streptomyces violaceus]|uniref:Uncharacterized protein n=1 Tax=Streptomyces violaceus TaxID=1936 RepID=A0ABY9UMP6_STRVL|nr:hypothetical protein [Streptomyces janthinus]WND24174.1 hypothetical protein RI060_43420 [Streptomyces janthinus]
MKRQAIGRMQRLAMGRDTLKTVEGVEQRTSMNDARIALCIAMGRNLDDIDATSGHDLSREAYESVRESWRWNIQMHGWNDWHERGLKNAMANWRERRPEFVDGDDWLDGLCLELK